MTLQSNQTPPERVTLAHHATAALAYCDYFATENFLCHMIVNELGFDQRYDTTVVAEASEFLALLERI